MGDYRGKGKLVEIAPFSCMSRNPLLLADGAAWIQSDALHKNRTLSLNEECKNDPFAEG